MRKPENRVLVLRHQMVLVPRQVFSSGARALSRSDVLWTERQWEGYKRVHKDLKGIEARTVEV